MNPNELLALAVNKDLDLEKLSKLMQMKKEWDADQARRAFFEAMTNFQSEVPEIRKSKKVTFGETKYDYAPLADITRQIKDKCKEHGLSYRWEIKDTKEEISVTCLITHLDGHTEQTTMTASPDDSGKKNKIQSRGSAIEYLKRYTLIGALGLSTTDSDIDGIMPEISLDILHKQYMEHYNELIQINPDFSKWHPDNWKSEPNQKLYLKAIGEIRKKLIEVTPKKAQMDFLDEIIDDKLANKWIQQGTFEWDQVRVGRFTASEMHRLMEPAKREMTETELKARPKKGKGSTVKLVNDYSSLSDAARTYINEKVAEVLTGQAKSQGYAFPLVWGNEHEEEAAEYFQKKTGLELEKVGFFTYTDHAGGSPDRFVGSDAILEIKCPYESVNQIKYLMLTDQFDVRREYFPYWVQCQANMLFTERNLCHFCTYDPRMKEDKHKLTHIEIKADEEFHELIREKLVQATKEKLHIISLL